MNTENTHSSLSRTSYTDSHYLFSSAIFKRKHKHFQIVQRRKDSAYMNNFGPHNSNLTGNVAIGADIVRLTNMSSLDLSTRRHPEPDWRILCPFSIAAIRNRQTGIVDRPPAANQKKLLRFHWMSETQERAALYSRLCRFFFVAYLRIIRHEQTGPTILPPLLLNVISISVLPSVNFMSIG